MKVLLVTMFEGLRRWFQMRQQRELDAGKARLTQIEVELAASRDDRYYTNRLEKEVALLRRRQLQILKKTGRV